MKHRCPAVGVLSALLHVCLVCPAAESSARTRLLPLQVSENKRFLVKADGTPFFYLADTAWELFHRLNRDEAVRYLSDRVAKGFTVIQAVALAEHGGLDKPNPYGHLPLVGKDPTRPTLEPGPENDYWDHVDFVLDQAEALGLYVGFLPTWGRYVTSDWFNGTVDGIFTVENALAYGRFLGVRYGDRPHMIWIIGGDRAAPTPKSRAIWRALARGIAIGVSEKEDYDKVLMTYHTAGPGHSSDFFHQDAWCDFDSIQSSHGHLIENWKMIERDYALNPVKPTIDLETTYPGLSIVKDQKDADDDDARRSAYWAVFAGAFGHTYGHNSIWQMYAPGRYPVLKAKAYWYDVLDAPSARQMGHLRRLMESRPFLARIPDQEIIASDPGTGAEHVRATRCSEGRYALVYLPTGNPVSVTMDAIAGERVTAWWFDPRTGAAKRIATFPKSGIRSFMPLRQGDGQDWVLVLDDAGRRFPPPGTPNRRR